ncbi:MAG: lasso peptide biosynthesis B2 protein [Nitrospiraceae bacterium]|nr:MAG: lasso peptide biosynthesis B2 protein [Nitrospiraceae bacterium]
MQLIKKIRSNFNSPGEILLFFRIFSLATILPLLVKFLTVPRLMKILTPQHSRSSLNYSTDEMSNKIEKYTDYILSRDFWMYKNICLKRSLILYRFLRKYGIYVSVCFGVRFKEVLLQGAAGKNMEGHAWLLYKGNIFLEKNPEEPGTYKITYCYPETKNDLSNSAFVKDIEGHSEPVE